jgi:mono/diheme cytochrome c family protein
MWRTNLTIVGLVIGVLALYTLVANSIPQIQSEIPQAVDLSGDVSPQQLAAAGERIFNGAGGCTACHGLGTRAPNLLTDEGGAGAIGARCESRVAGMSCKDYLYQSLTEPAVHVVEGYQPIMQDLSRTLPVDQIWAVVAFLESQGGTVDVTADDVRSAQQPVGGGGASPPAGAAASLDPREIMTANGCLGCHKLGDQGAAIGPPFDGMGGRLTSDFIRASILNPGAAITRGYEAMAGVMPPTFGQQLTAAQLEAVVNFLSSQR